MTKEALKLALEALEDLGMKHYENTGEVLYKETFTAIKVALEAEDGWTPERIAGMARLKEAQDKKLAQQEPVAWEQFYPEMGSPKLAYLSPTESLDNACYIPPQRKPLTDEEITEIFSTTKGLDFYLNFARAIEAAHGIKGEA